MKNASTAAKAILAGGQFVVAALYAITPKLGTSTYYFTDFALPLSAAIYPSGTKNKYLNGLTITKNDLQQKVGTDGAEMTLTISPQPDAVGGPPLIAGYSFGEAARLGVLDGATVLVSLLFMNYPTVGVQFDTSPGGVAWMLGVMDQMQGGRLKIDFKIRSMLSLMTVQMPRSCFQTGCSHNFTDIGCDPTGSIKTAQTFTGTVSSSSASSFNTSLTKADGYFSLGAITFTSGVNNGVAATVKQSLNAAGNLTLFTPLPTAPAIGDTFSILAGCDKLQATCSGKFGNLIHFKGEPYIPIPETMIDGGTSNPPQQTAGNQAGVIVGSGISSNSSSA